MSLWLFSTSAWLIAQEPVPLPVRKVVLYKNGMGYFEHLGPVRGEEAVEIVLPSAQLNDVLKSLTVLDLGQGRVTGVTYDSNAPLERRLSEIPIDLRSAEGLVGFLNELRGTGVEIRTPSGMVAGKLMGAELRTKRTGNETTSQVVELTSLSQTGELRLVDLESARALKFTDTDLAADLNRYLDLLGSTHQRDIRRLRIQTAGSGQRQLHVSYTSESPIWKMTYRIVLGPGEKPLLQGWAVVDNTTPLDWNDVSLSLVSGAPVSFVQNLSQPLYARRPVVPLPQGLQVNPQTHQATLVSPTGITTIAGRVRDASGRPIPGTDIIVLDDRGNRISGVVSNARGGFQVEVNPGSYKVKAVLPGFQTLEYAGISVQSGRTTSLDFTLQVDGTASSVLEVAAAEPESRRGRRNELRAIDRLSSARVADEASAPMAAVGGIGTAMRQQKQQTASAQALGEQFEYRLPHPVTIRRNQSGLLPILHTELKGEKVSVFTGNSGSDGSRPRLAVWLENSSGITLDSGSFTVIDSNAFAGEGLTETVQAGEKRLLSYALDLGVEVSTRIESQPQRVDRVEINRGVLRMHSKLVQRRTYTVRNNDDRARTVIIEHPVQAGWEMVNTSPPAETTSSYHRFRVPAKPKTTNDLTVSEQRPQQTTYSIRNISPDQISVWLRQRSIDPEIEEALAGLVAKQNEINAISKRASILQKEQSEIFRDQERLRGNLQRLRQTPEEASLRQRYIRQLEAQEDRLEVLRRERERLETEQTKAQQEMDELLQGLTMDRKL